MEEQSVVRLDNVTFRYSDGAGIDHVTLSVAKGDFLGILGPNGSGKTTLLRIIVGLLTPQSGSVTLFGEPLAKFHDWPKIGYIPQKVTQLETRFPVTVEEVVSLGCVATRGLFQRLSKNERCDIDKAIDYVGLSDMKKKKLTELSGGQQQRVFIAKALASEPQLLILDEPTVGVDATAQEAFYQLLSKLNKESNLTLILVSHDIDVVVNEVNKLVCINKELIYHGSPKEFIKEDYMEKLYGHERKFILHGH